ncbi:MAG: class D sortase, partial [Oscillospiraceae bacterium]|nr:class D sortase [Oscillospiraceae bacterium]
TPNLAPGGMDGGLVNSVGNIDYSSLPSVDGSSVPSIPGSSDVTVTTAYTWQDSGYAGYTEVTSDLYYGDGSLGTLKIPSIGVNTRIVQGTDSAALAKGIGHFTDTSIWSGNVCLASHNRGANAYFGKIHTLREGDTIILTTQLGTRTYSVTSVEKVSETDSSGTASTAGNQITLYTCVRDERDFRWCVTAVELV